MPCVTSEWKHCMVQHGKVDLSLCINHFLHLGLQVVALNKQCRVSHRLVLGHSRTSKSTRCLLKLHCTATIDQGFKLSCSTGVRRIDNVLDERIQWGKGCRLDSWLGCLSCSQNFFWTRTLALNDNVMKAIKYRMCKICGKSDV